jgi:hypothetical protein
MRIRITAVTSIADGAGHRYRSGQVVDVDDDLAAAWITAGHAVQADGQQAPPASPKQAAKRAATRRAPRRTTRST